jgi:hypothetical protein
VHGRIELGEQALREVDGDVHVARLVGVKVDDGRFHTLEREDAVAFGEVAPRVDLHVQPLGLRAAVDDEGREVAADGDAERNVDAVGAGEAGEGAPFVDGELLAGLERGRGFGPNLGRDRKVKCEGHPCENEDDCDCQKVFHGGAPSDFRRPLASDATDGDWFRVSAPFW